MNSKIRQITKELTPGYSLNEQGIPLSIDIWSTIVSRLKPCKLNCTSETRPYAKAVKALCMSCKALYLVTEFRELSTRLVELVKKQDEWDEERAIYDYYDKGWYSKNSIK